MAEVELTFLANMKPPWVKQRESVGLLFGSCKCPVYLGYPCHFATKLQPWNWVFNRGSFSRVSPHTQVLPQTFTPVAWWGIATAGMGTNFEGEKEFCCHFLPSRRSSRPIKSGKKILKPLSNSNSSTLPVVDHITELFSVVLPCGLPLVLFPSFYVYQGMDYLDLDVHLAEILNNESVALPSCAQAPACGCKSTERSSVGIFSFYNVTEI